MSNRAIQTGLVSMLCIFPLLGCSTSETGSDGIADSSKQFLLNSRPAAATNLAEAKLNLDKDDSVIIEGWADLKFFESQNNKAMFLVREILEDAPDHGGEGHDPSTCPFCKRRMEAAPKAAVVFTGEDKKVLPRGIEDIFPIKHGGKVIVKGSGKLDENLDLFKITATGIHFPESE